MVAPRIIELRQYTVHPQGREVLIRLFDEFFVESQEELGMAIVGQFRDLDRPDRFVWVRGFADMASRVEALTSFYTGQAWAAKAAEANATMVDVDDVLLLRPRMGFSTLSAVRPPVGAPSGTQSAVLVTTYLRDRPFDDAFAEFFEQQVRPALSASGADPIAWLETEYAENNFPALPVREGTHAFVWFARFDRLADLDDHLARWPAVAPAGISAS